jgi:hypothetical protein
MPTLEITGPIRIVPAGPHENGLGLDKPLAKPTPDTRTPTIISGGCKDKLAFPKTGTNCLSSNQHLVGLDSPKGRC